MFSSFGFKAGCDIAKWSGIGEGLTHNKLEAGEKCSGAVATEVFSYSTK